ncbi:Copine domain-containing protein [Meloidogyne graminicola]|uniref:Copine domain-containing protein n=1 Tax=Meloidogyne graminicola TaxID=189291 RepID=A0A8S9ZEE6_9BILA|nr:Copine domain-containing protein [Meloidogyne graminicola]
MDVNKLKKLIKIHFLFLRLHRIALLGFGAKLPPSFQFSSLFALNGSLDTPWLRSTSDILNYYKNFSMSLLPFAPTQYSQVIHYVIKLAKVAKKAQADIHFSLIILTNGQLRDPSDTIDNIVEASFLPISIFFILIGNNSHPAGETNIRRVCSPTIKSSKNLPLQRETASLISGNHPSLTQQLINTLSRQLILYRLYKNDKMN